MKILFLTFALISVLYSDSFDDSQKNSEIQNAYELAQKYEEENRTTEAFFWYKEAARIAAKNDNTSATESDLEEFLANNDSFPNTNTTQEHVKYIKYLSEYDDDDTKNSVVQILSSSFGILPYRTNFLLPITYDLAHHNDDRSEMETMFQFSFKKDLLKDILGFNETFGIAYTQRSWWQTMKHSTPFRETNYLPEIYLSLPFWNDSSFFKSYKFAFLHESNGQNDPASRSWNRLYLEGFFHVKGLFINPRIWYRIYESKRTDDNPDILDYMGYGDLTLTYPHKDQLFKVLLRNNFDWDNNRGAVQAEWTFPIFKSGAFGYVQLFDGYGESLIDYNERTRRISIGFALSR
jgi:phospholipase A1